MKRLLSYGSVAFLFAAFAAPERIELEWSERNETDVPYEVEIDAARLERLAGVPKNAGYVVTACLPNGEANLPVILLPGKDSDGVVLRFSVPAGTTRLFCTPNVGRAKFSDAAEADNLFAGALSDGALRGWMCEKGATATVRQDGVALCATNLGSPVVSCRVAVPAVLAGQPVRLELGVRSLARLAWANVVHVLQYDARGRRLAEEVVDARWLSHNRPPERDTLYREKGRLHPLARSVEIRFTLTSIRRSFDERGLPVDGMEMSLAKLLVKTLALRPAAVLPFPRQRDEFFGEGVSGKPGDASLRLGGDKAFFFETGSQASWSDGIQLRDEKLRFYPFGAGTVEAWFKPDWQPGATNAVPLFEASHHFSNFYPTAGGSTLGEMLGVGYCPKDRRICYRIKDVYGHAYAAAVDCTIATGRWTHVAVQWNPGKEAELFVDGRRVLAFAISEYRAVNPADRKNKWPNDMGAMEFYLGSSWRTVRTLVGTDPNEPYFAGEADLLRISSGRRHAGDFQPVRELSVDADTRALFGFDRSIDGSSGGGIGWISGSLRADEGLVDRRLRLGNRVIDYYPAKMAAKNDPDRAIDTLNFRHMPTVADFRAARETVRRTFDVKPGDTIRLTCPQDVRQDYVEIANTGSEPLVHPLVIGAGEIDPRSPADLRDSLGLAGGTDRERVDRLYQFLIGASDYFMNHTIVFEPGQNAPFSVPSRQLVMLNGYCAFECADLNTFAAGFFSTACGCPAAVKVGYGHVFEHVFFDGKSHLYDLTFQNFYTGWDNETCASLEEIEREPGILYRFSRRSCPMDNWLRLGTRGPCDVRAADYRAKVAVTLHPGEVFRVWRANDGRMNDLQMSRRADSDRKRLAPKDDYTDVCGGLPDSYWGFRIWRIDRFFPLYGNAYQRYCGRPTAENAAFSGRTPTSFCYRVTCPFPIVYGEYAARRKDGAPVRIELSTDRGVTFRPLPTGKDGVARLTYLVRARHEYLLRFAAPPNDVVDFDALTESMVNVRVQPGRLVPGENVLTFKATSGERARVTVQYRTGKRPLYVKDGVYSGAVPGEERELILVESSSVTHEIVGGGAETKAIPSKGLQTTLTDGRLTVTPLPGATPRFESVAFVDGASRRDLTVIVAPGARLLRAADAKLTDAELIAASDRQVQDCVMFRKNGSSATFSFAGLKRGNYQFFVLERFASGERGAGRTARDLHLKLPNGRTLKAGSVTNDGADFLLAKFGEPGGRGNFKWDFPFQGGTGHPFREIDRTWLETGANTISCVLNGDLPNGAELAAILVMPAPPREFKCDLLKLLLGLNCDPWRVVPPSHEKIMSD